MRVLLASQFYPPVVGGEERMVMTLGGALSRRGHDVSVVTLDTGDGPIEADGSGIRVHRLRGLAQRIPGLHSEAGRRHMPPFPDPAMVRALRRVITAERPDVVHAHNWIVHSLVPALAPGTPLVLTLHDYSLGCATKRLMHNGATQCDGPTLRRCLPCATRHYGAAKGTVTALGLLMSQPRLHRRVGMFIGVSTAVVERSGLERAGLPHCVIPNFLPEETAAADPPDERLLADLPDEFIMFAGDVAADKGAHILIAAHQALGAAAPPLVLIGRRSADVEVPSGGRVFATGIWPHATVMEAWRRSSVAVVPSLLSEPFGLVALEAMACACAVIVSRTGALADIVVDGESGVVVTPGDIAGLSDALRSLLDDPARRARLAAGARERARVFAEGPAVAAIETVYEGVRRAGS